MFRGISKTVQLFRFVDGSFAIFSMEADRNSFLSALNFLYPCLTFIVEREADGKIFFLDVLVDNANS